jgi:hypothetical protein
MLMERAVYNLKREVVGYMLFKQDVNDDTETEVFYGFKEVL